jgi:SAM-dependent methyltransferase
MNQFNKYARYYDLLYSGKDYCREVVFVGDQLRGNGIGGNNILDLGCGTGRHAVEFARRGWNVTGIDLSEAMVFQANARREELSEWLKASLMFKVGDARTVRLNNVFDSVVSLFHVINYQSTNGDLEAHVATAAIHLKDNGSFMFDFWYGPAVLNDPPVVRIKRLIDPDLEVIRLAEPEMLPNLNQVAVNYHVILRDRHTNEVEQVKERHLMRYLFIPEIVMVLEKYNFDLVSTGSWCSERALGLDSWYGYAVARKRNK